MSPGHVTLAEEPMKSSLGLICNGRSKDVLLVLGLLLAIFPVERYHLQIEAKKKKIYI
jgi:hypothetical protein